MKALPTRPTRGLQIGTVLRCADNSGAKLLEIISIRGYKGVRRTRPTCSVGDLVTCRVKSGTEKVRHEVFKVVVIRQKKEYRRPSGIRVEFEDNAGVVVNDKFDPVGTLIKGPVAREAVERFKTVGKLANIIA